LIFAGEKMQSPAVMFIESAVDMLKTVPEWMRQSQLKELHSFGDARAQRLGASGVSVDFQKGYELGLQTARVIIMTSPAVMLKGVKPEDVL
jgi:hypothetical protein